VIGAITAGLYGAPIPPVYNSYESIATVTVGAGGASSIDFTSIPSTYKHLQIRGITKLAGATSDDNILARFNGNATSGNYGSHYLFGNGNSGSSAQAGASVTSQTSMFVGRTTGANTASGIFGAAVIDVLDYQNTNKNKVVRNLSGHDYNGSGMIWFESGFWLSTAAITSISIFANSNFSQHSSFALYGIKG
jgi:hypothetical protein